MPSACKLALPTAVCSAVYASSGYSASAMSFAGDNAFGDGVSLQTAPVTGNVAAGYEAVSTVGMAG